MPQEQDGTWLAGVALLVIIYLLMQQGGAPFGNLRLFSTPVPTDQLSVVGGGASVDPVGGGGCS